MTTPEKGSGEVGIYKVVPEATDQQVQAYLQARGVKVMQHRSMQEKVMDKLTDKAADMLTDIALSVVAKTADAVARIFSMPDEEYDDS